MAAPGSALAKKMASAKGASAEPKAEPVPEQPKEIKPEPAPKAATRLAAKRPHSTHDLFAAVDQAGSEIDVDTSEVEGHDHSKATGARNENSVLFSLDALKSGLGGGAKPAQQSAAGPRKKAPGPPAKRLEDLMSFDAGSPMMRGMGGGGLLLSGNEALLTAPAPPPPKPEPKPVPVAATSGAGADVYMPPRRNKLGLIVGIVAGILAVGAGGAMIALKFSSNNASGAASSEIPVKLPASVSALSAPPNASAGASATSSATALPSAAAPSAVVSASAAPVNVGKVGVGSAVAKAAAESKASTKESKPAEASFPAAAGGFSKDAAVAALSVAASQATVCKRPEGPWGSGKALVTFAPSGRVTTANVTGPPFSGTPVGGCVASVFRRARIPSFSGDSVTVSKSFSISP